MSFKKKPTVKEEMVRLSQEEQAIYYSSTWYMRLALRRRLRLINAGIITWPNNEWAPPKVSAN